MSTTESQVRSGASVEGGSLPDGAEKEVLALSSYVTISLEGKAALRQHLEKREMVYLVKTDIKRGGLETPLKDISATASSNKEGKIRLAADIRTDSNFPSKRKKAAGRLREQFAQELQRTFNPKDTKIVGGAIVLSVNGCEIHVEVQSKEKDGNKEKIDAISIKVVKANGMEEENLDQALSVFSMVISSVVDKLYGIAGKKPSRQEIVFDGNDTKIDNSKSGKGVINILYGGDGVQEEDDTDEDPEEILREYRLESTGITFKDIGGQDEAVEELEEIVEYIKEMGLEELDRGILLVGRPGVGKTQIMRAFATEVDAVIIRVTSGHILSSGLGDAEHKIDEIFENAEKLGEKLNKPIIIFIDELSSLVSKDMQHKQISDHLLTVMDGMTKLQHVLVVGSTNNIDRIPEAFIREGRFGNVIYMEYPKTDKGYQKIFEIGLLRARSKFIREEISRMRKKEKEPSLQLEERQQIETRISQLQEQLQQLRISQEELDELLKLGKEALEYGLSPAEINGQGAIIDEAIRVARKQARLAHVSPVINIEMIRAKMLAKVKKKREQEGGKGLDLSYKETGPGYFHPNRPPAPADEKAS